MEVMHINDNVNDMENDEYANVIVNNRLCIFEYTIKHILENDIEKDGSIVVIHPENALNAIEGNLLDTNSLNEK